MKKCKDCKWFRENIWCQYIGIMRDPEGEPCEKFKLNPEKEKEKEERDESREN